MTLTVYKVLGQWIATLVDRRQPRGTYTVDFYYVGSAGKRQSIPIEDPTTETPTDSVFIWILSTGNTGRGEGPTLHFRQYYVGSKSEWERNEREWYQRNQAMMDSVDAVANRIENGITRHAADKRLDGLSVAPSSAFP